MKCWSPAEKQEEHTDTPPTIHQFVATCAQAERSMQMGVNDPETWREAVRIATDAGKAEVAQMVRLAKTLWDGGERNKAIMKVDAAVLAWADGSGA